MLLRPVRQIPPKRVTTFSLLFCYTLACVGTRSNIWVLLEKGPGLPGLLLSRHRGSQTQPIAFATVSSGMAKPRDHLAWWWHASLLSVVDHTAFFAQLRYCMRMDLEMLKHLSFLSGGKPAHIDTAAFFSRFPRTEETYQHLDALQSKGYILVLPIGADPAYAIYVTAKGLGYCG